MARWPDVAISSVTDGDLRNGKYSASNEKYRAIRVASASGTTSVAMQPWTLFGTLTNMKKLVSQALCSTPSRLPDRQLGVFLSSGGAFRRSYFLNVVFS